MSALIGDHAAESFPPVIEAIENGGSVPQHVRRWIAEQLVGAGTRYQLRAQAKSARSKPAQEIQRLEVIAASSTKLLKLLGSKHAAALAKGWPPGGLPSPLSLLLPDLQMVAKERRESAATMDAFGRAKTLLILLSDLTEASRRAGKRYCAATCRGRGGARREPQALAGLVFDILDIYADVRKRCPKSGPQPGYGGPLVRFVRACLKAIAPDLAEPSGVAIRSYLRGWGQRSTV
jgi:hypothetical protein